MDISNIFTDDTHTHLRHDSVPYQLRDLASAFRMSGGPENEQKAQKLEEAADLYIEEAYRRIGAQLRCMVKP